MSAAPVADRRLNEVRALKRAALMATLLTLPVVVLEMGGHVVPVFHHWIEATVGMQTSWTVQFVLATMVLVGPGRRFFTSGVPLLLKGRPT